MGHHSELSPVGWNSAQSKCSAEVLEGQLVSFVPSSSAGHGCTLVCMNITCWRMTVRSVALAWASTRMRRLLRQLHAVPSVRRSCSLMMPDRSSVRWSDVQVASSDC